MHTGLRLSRCYRLRFYHCGTVGPVLGESAPRLTPHPASVGVLLQSTALRLVSPDGGALGTWDSGGQILGGSRKKIICSIQLGRGANAASRDSGRESKTGAGSSEPVLVTAQGLPFAVVARPMYEKGSGLKFGYAGM